MLALEGVKIDAGDDDVAAELAERDGRAAEVSGDGGEVFGLDQGDLAVAIGAAVVVVADQAVLG